jgi:hypothetical protein
MIKQTISIFATVALFSGYTVAQQSIRNSTPDRTISANTVPSKTSHAAEHENYQQDTNTQGEKCLQHSKTELLKASNEQYRLGWESAKEMTARVASEIESGDRATPPVYTIPVVFHVIHKGESVGSVTNISSVQIQSAVDALNRDYRRTGADGGIAQGAGPDTEIQFCLAGVDPNGNPHSGINRVNGTGVSGYSSNGITNSNEGTVKALSKWDNRYYLNVWVVSEINGNGADVSNVNNFFGGTIGYAYQPTNPVTWNSDLDGIVILNLSVGNDPNGTNGYRLWGAGETNRTLTHEVGHYLGLSHPFNDNNPNACSNGDGIGDTPNAQQVNMFNCNYNGSCSGQQIENYMDYTPEQCQDQFTSGQSTNMRSVLAGVRNEVVNTSNCGSSTDYDAAITAIATPNGGLCAETFTPVVTLTNYGSTNLTSVQIEYYVDANGPTTYNWSGSLGSNGSTQVTLNALSAGAGAHTFTAQTLSGTLNTNNTDQETGNDQLISNFNVGSGGTGITLTIELDCWGEETTWEIRNASNTVVASGGPYTNVLPTGAGTQVETACLTEGCYDFTISDSEGDGIYGTQWSSCDVDGDYTIVDDGNTTLVTMTAANGDFGSSATHNFCIGGGSENPSCDILTEFDGTSFYINPVDEPNFEALILDNDEEPVSTQLTGYSSNWMLGFYEEVSLGDTNWFIGSTSWHDNPTAPADNWLTFGPVTMLDDDGEIRWKHYYPDNDYRDGYEVLVGTLGTGVADFNGATSLFTVSDNAPTTDGDTIWTQQSVSLPAGTYANQSLYFAFHHNALDMFLLFLDDIEVEGCTNSITAINNVKENFELKVFPNPSSGNFMFQYQDDSDETLSFVLLNAIGQEVWNESYSSSNSAVQTIETQSLNSGVYTLVVKGESINVSERLILTK